MAATPSTRALGLLPGIPLLRFTLEDGSVVETRSEVPVDGLHEVGDRVEVLYLPDAPARARVAT